MLGGYSNEGSGGDSDGGSAGYSSDYSDDEQPAAAAAGRGSKHKPGRHREQQQGLDSGSDYSDGEGGAEPDVAYMGMARKSDKQQQQQPAVKQKAAVAASKPQPPEQQQQQKQKLSIAEQEAMALQLLAAKPW